MLHRFLTCLLASNCDSASAMKLFAAPSSGLSLDVAAGCCGCGCGCGEDNDRGRREDDNSSRSSSNGNGDVVEPIVGELPVSKY